MLMICIIEEGFIFICHNPRCIYVQHFLIIIQDGLIIQDGFYDTVIHQQRTINPRCFFRCDVLDLPIFHTQNAKKNTTSGWHGIFLKMDRESQLIKPWTKTTGILGILVGGGRSQAMRFFSKGNVCEQLGAVWWACLAKGWWDEPNLSRGY